MWKFDFFNRQMNVFKSKIKIIDDKSNNKLLVEGIKACQVFKFEEIGT